MYYLNNSHIHSYLYSRIWT